MAKTYETINAELKAWIAEQRVFFTATAPLAADGRVNCSPKAGDTFRVLGDREAAYLDLTGSGIETVAHLQENGRIVILFCAFTGPPRIVRLHGQGTVVYPNDSQYDALKRLFPEHPGARAVIRIDVERISDSCGYNVPLYDYCGPRDVLDRWSEKKGADGLAAYRKEKNRFSIDDIPGYEPG